ncbi:MAG: C39 family peptidase [Clostridia bacterium]|nr:C39 family peptidase [Clostridia bacterium]
MLEDIKSIHHELHNCIEDTLASLALTLEREYILMFAEAWNFSYNPRARRALGTFGNSVDYGEYKVFGCIDRYHGIGTECNYKGDINNQLEVMKKEFQQGKAVILWMDAFFVPWTPVFNKYHRPHYCIGIGIDEAEGVIKCDDPFWNKHQESIPFKSFEDGNGKCLSVNLSDRGETDLDWHEVVTIAAQQVLGDGEKGNIFSAMCKFADDAEESLDLAAEIKGYEEKMFLAPLFMHMTQIGSSRGNFARVLVYLSEKFEVEQLLLLSREMEKAGANWIEMRNTLMGAYHKGDRGMVIKVMDEIRAMADHEESIAKRLIEVSNEYKE